jgi:hypothetical protein
MKQLIRAVFLAVSLGLIQAGPFTATAPAQMSMQTGLLTCHVASGFGYIVASSRTMTCTYEPWLGHSEDYSGTISKIGIDLGYLGSFVLVWAVIAPNFSADDRGALAGTYVGATAQAVALLGAGVNVMTGGFRRSIALQPISVEGNTGLYVGAGLASINLQARDYY